MKNTTKTTFVLTVKVGKLADALEAVTYFEDAVIAQVMRQGASVQVLIHATGSTRSFIKTLNDLSTRDIVSNWMGAEFE